MGWYSKVSRDISEIPNAIDFFENELTAARAECRLSGNVEKAAANLPGIVEHRFHQLQEIEAILEYLNICLLYTSPSPRDATLSRMPSSA